MKMPRNVLIIGSADILFFRGLKKTRRQSRMFTNHLLAVNRTGTTLYIFPNRTAGKKKARSGSGRSDGKIHTEVKYEIPEVVLRRTGKVMALQYTSDWWEGEMTKYEHDFDVPPFLYSDGYARSGIMAIKASRGKIVTRDGLVG